MRNFGLLHKAVEHWAALKPDEPAAINATRGTVLTWAELDSISRALAGKLARLGFAKGDFLATSLPLTNEHILLEYACFRLGVIHAPLDLRLPPADAIRSIAQIRARGYAFAGPLGEAVRGACPTVEHLIQFAGLDACIPQAIPFATLMSGAEVPFDSGVQPHDGAQAIFTTGSTGSPKPALLSHGGIACQNLCLGRAFEFGPGHRVLCNLPASHVGGQAELLMTAFAAGATAVTLETFDAALSLEAIERYKVTLIGQIPAMFNMEWRSASYAQRDLSSLQIGVYGGQSVPDAFLHRLLEMAPRIATGLGLTESSGFCTYTKVQREPTGNLGWPAPEYEMSIRAAMEHGGQAGSALSPGEVGNVCFRGPQNFLGYVGDPGATAAALSRDGWLYTGDLGTFDDNGLRLCGRAKWVLKPAGYQVFPGDIENHLSELTAQVANVGVVGHPHRMWSEGIVAFVEKRPGASLASSDLRRHARSLASYMRPLHYIILEPGAMPLNRAAKVDILRLRELAAEEVGRLRQRGRWDSK